MTLKEILEEKKAAIVDRWLEDTLATYPGDTPAFFKRQKDPFANPVGHALRVGTRAVFEGLLNGIEADKICHHLDEIIKIRAIQDFSPSQTISFVFLLKKIARKEAGKVAMEPQLAAEWVTFDADVDQIALFAFDIYARCREQLHELRINEVKRSVSALINRSSKSQLDSQPDANMPEDKIEQACTLRGNCR